MVLFEICVKIEPKSRKTAKAKVSGMSKYEKYTNEFETILKHFLVVYHSPTQR